MSRLRALYDWIDQRMAVSALLQSTALHAVPANAGSWFYVFGSATLLCLVMQLVTGVCLALVYVPSAAEAWTSLEYLNYEVPLGWYLRALHYWGSNFMVALMSIHMAQVFLFGAYKYPRELTWLSGCVLFLLTLGMAFTGQVMRFDQDAYWGLGIGMAIAGRTPLIGEQLVHAVLGGPIIGAATLSRFFTLHVFVLIGALIAVVTLHLRLVLKNGINEFPDPDRPVDRETYREEYEGLIRRTGVPFFPNAIGKDLVFGGIVMLAILGAAAFFGPNGPNGPPDPDMIRTVPRPDFYFLPLFSVFALLPPYTETFLILVGPVVGIVLLFLIPFMEGEGQKHPLRRPVAMLAVVMAFLTLGSLAWLGESSPWSPHMQAWSGTPLPAFAVEGRSPVELAGAAVFQNKQCRNCHSVGGTGGKRGPELDDVAVRLTKNQLIRQVLQGGGNMPAYGKQLRPAEVEALVSWLGTLHPRYEPPARPGAGARAAR